MRTADQGLLFVDPELARTVTGHEKKFRKLAFQKHVMHSATRTAKASVNQNLQASQKPHKQA